VSTTLPTAQQANELARALIDRRLAACVQVSGPITSTYRWQGRVEQSQEWVCTAKTRADAFERIQRAISELHPYEVPEVIATPLAAMAASYAAWFEQQLAESGD
jgi:periplasmic divalent cation tolerance protein